MDKERQTEKQREQRETQRERERRILIASVLPVATLTSLRCFWGNHLLKQTCFLPPLSLPDKGWLSGREQTDIV